MILSLLLSIVLQIGDSLYLNRSRLCEEPDAKHVAVVERADTIIELKLFTIDNRTLYGMERFSVWNERKYTRKGWQEYYDKNGNLAEREFYNREGHRELREVYYANGGPVRLIYTYTRGQVELNQYYMNGNVKRHEIQRSKKIIGECYTESGAMLKFTPFAVQPQFVGGKDAMYAYLDKNIKYPRQCRKEHIEGRAIVEFIVTEHGAIQDVEIFRSSGNDLLDEEAIRLVQEMPAWNPGTEDGRETDMRQTVSVTFHIK
ncbi:MAG: energy transducer TonB [Paludibacteraceae bacterium]|nr:energy transducer TonB [Paludibacteraceae bacterium]